MEHFELPHDHGEKSHTAALCRELGKTGHFAAVSDVFKQLSDSNRVRIFWLLSHQEACVVNIAAMLEMSSPLCPTTCAHWRRAGCWRAAGRGRRSITGHRTRS